jgi:hypothetical protein
MTGNIFVSFFISEWQSGHVGCESNEKASLIHPEHESLVHLQIAVSASGTGSCGPRLNPIDQKSPFLLIFLLYPIFD